jgi:GrpB-like predicted nucleotidyltransferase (UPF0157 family)
LHVKESTLRTDVLCPFESKAFGLDVGVQLVANGSRFEFFLTFRDRTNENAALRNAYNELKRSASPLSMAEYREVKSAFVEAVLAGSSLPSPRSLRGGVDGAW